MSLRVTSSRVFRRASHKIRSLLLQSRRSISTGENAASYEDSDVVIVGGGPAGLALASALGIHSRTMIPNESNLCAKEHLR